MNFKTYNERNLLNYNYAVLSYDEEDNMYYIISLHKDKESALKRCKYLDKKVDEDICREVYFITTVDDLMVKRSFNFEKVSE